MKPKPRNRDIAAVEYWNAHYPVGTPVRVFPGPPEMGRSTDTVTRSEAQLLYDKPVVWVEGKTGCWGLSHVVPLESPRVWVCRECSWTGRNPEWESPDVGDHDDYPVCPECSSTRIHSNIIIKALSLKQPWANMIGEKTIETRKWSTDYRGPLLIVASKTPDLNVFEFSEIKGPFGKAVAKALLVDCRRMEKADETAACCRIYPGAFAWILEDIKPINIPFPVKGQLGLYDVEMEG
jgi:hypothetical protein